MEPSATNDRTACDPFTRSRKERGMERITRSSTDVRLCGRAAASTTRVSAKVRKSVRSGEKDEGFRRRKTSATALRSHLENEKVFQMAPFSFGNFCILM